MNTESQTELLDLFITAESRCAELYTLFAATLGEHRELWKKMAADEKRHAEVLEGLSLMVAAGEASFGEREMRTDVMKMFLDYVDVLAREAREGRIPEKRALGIAVDETLHLVFDQVRSTAALGDGAIHDLAGDLVGERVGQRHRHADHDAGTEAEAEVSPDQLPGSRNVRHRNRRPNPGRPSSCPGSTCWPQNLGDVSGDCPTRTPPPRSASPRRSRTLARTGIRTR